MPHGRDPTTGTKSGAKSADSPEAAGFKLPDPAAVGRSMADIAERSQRIVSEWLKRQDQEEHDADPLNIGSAFLEMTARLMANPAQLMQAQIGFWQDYMTLWQNTARRMMGMETEPVIDAPSTDRRFKDDAWKRERGLRLHQAVLPAVGALRAGRGEAGRRAGHEDRAEGRFLFAPVHRRDEPVELPADQPRGAAQDRRDRRREPAEGPEQPAGRPGARQGQAAHQDDRHGRLQASARTSASRPARWCSRTT